MRNYVSNHERSNPRSKQRRLNSATEAKRGNTTVARNKACSTEFALRRDQINQANSRSCSCSSIHLNSVEVVDVVDGAVAAIKIRATRADNLQPR